MKFYMKGESHQTNETTRIRLGDITEEDEDEFSFTTSTKSRSEEDSSEEVIAAKEERLVKYSKGLVLLVIFAVALGMGCITYVFVKEQQDDEFKNHFREVSSELISISQARARDIYDNLEALSATMTSLAAAEKQVWPYVVIRDFQAHALISNQITGASRLAFVPIVKHQDRAQWEAFSANTSFGMFAAGHDFDDSVHPALYVEKRFNGTPSGTPDHLGWNETGMLAPFIWDSVNNSRVPSEPADVYYPAWQTAPASDYTPYTNIDVKRFDFFARVIKGMLETDRPVLTEVTAAGYIGQTYELRFDPQDLEEPHSYLFQPIYDSLLRDRSAVAILMALFKWGQFFENVLREYESNIMVVMYGTRNQTFSYELQGAKPVFLGNEDFHDRQYNGLGVDFDIAPFAELPETSEREYCQYNGRIYPTAAFKEPHFTNDPYFYAAGVVACFIVTTLVFIIYDYLAKQRQKRVMEQAVKTTKIVNSMFPANVRARLMDGGESEQYKKQGAWPGMTKTIFTATKGSPSNEVNTSEAIYGSKPIADFFPSTTIMFADMTGFTAWSSTREPTQVFMLLETVYHSFDMIAKRRKVFKVETIGDCYVAVAGVPTPRPNHAVVMARFASDCHESMQVQVQHLETSLGPDTSMLSLRIGLHSGPVTAGVLRGDKGRFQLFGDTMNTASRMESTSEKGQIQVSRETANLLTAAGKGSWLSERDSKVLVKGKGELRTFYLRIRDGSAGTFSGDSSSSSNNLHPVVSLKGTDKERVDINRSNTDDKKERLVGWNCSLLATHLKAIAAGRSSKCMQQPLNDLGTTSSPIEEVQDVLNLPHFNPRASQKVVDPRTVVLSPDVLSQLNDFVSKVAASYPNNPFHNFEHASHVTMSVTKLMSRIVQPNSASSQQPGNAPYALTFSDPLIQLSAILSALFHDAEHPGVGNAVLVQEEDPMAIQYHGKSVAEQNSVDVCYNLLMQPQYKALQGAIFAHDPVELKRFRSMIVQCVLATDIQDKDLGALRRARWETAFVPDGTIDPHVEKDAPTGADEHLAVNRKATIVLEHLMQASDVSHTMQHWHVFRKWNECLFREVYFSYLDGRIQNDPSVGWYKGELGFFDFYIIPLAKKLETCGVFGVSSTEYLGYALENRIEWEEKGQSIVQEYMGTATAIWEKLKQKREEEAVTRTPTTLALVRSVSVATISTPASEVFQDEETATDLIWV